MGYIQKLTGVITHVGDIDFVGKSETPKQLIVLHIDGYEHQGYSFPEEDWEIELFGLAVEKHNIHERAIGEKAEVKFSATSKGWFNQVKGTTYYNVTNRLKEITWLGEKVGGVTVPAATTAPTPDQNSGAPGEEDDLPF